MRILRNKEKSEIKIDNLIYGFDNNGNRVELFVNGVLGDIDYVDNTFYYEPKEKIKIVNTTIESQLKELDLDGVNLSKIFNGPMGEA